MTTSLAIAEGTENTHEAVIKLVRKYVEDLQQFGTFGFEIQKSGGRPTEIAYLNEPQATLLITYLRNSEIVRKFKIALVKAFYELRDRVRATEVDRNDPLTLSHRADIAVAADRTFRAMLRSGRSAGLPMGRAIRRANEITLGKTGVNLLAELQAEDIHPENPSVDDDPVASAITSWAEQAGWGVCYSMDTIVRQAFGLPVEADTQRYAAPAGPVLKALGFRRKLDRAGPTMRRVWVRD